MEWIEKEAFMTPSLDCRPRFLRRYVDNVLEVINKDSIQNLTNHLNTIDPTGSHKVHPRRGKPREIPFLDTLIVRKEDGSVKLLVYWKKTHTDQYLNLRSQYPFHHKLGVLEP